MSPLLNSVHSEKYKSQVLLWLFTGCFLVFGMVVVGGITRLTGSRLSITEWKVISGSIPPLNEAQWMEAFEKYKQIPQYQQQNSHFELADFKFIYFWEFIHRLFGRLIGIVFLVGLIYFLWKKAISVNLLLKLLFMFALGGAHGGASLHLAGGRERIDDAAAVVRGKILEDPQPPELDVHFYFHEMRGEAVARRFPNRRLRRRGPDEHAIAGRQSLRVILPLQVFRGLDHRVAGKIGGAAARFTDGVRGTVGVATDDRHTLERRAQRFGRNQRHRRLGAAAAVRHAHVYDIAALRVQADNSAAAADARVEAAHRHAGAAFERAGVRGRLTPALTPAERLGAAADAVLQPVARVRQFVVVLPRHVLETEVQRVDLQLVRDVIHQRVEAEDPLRIRRCAVIGRNGGVRVSRIDRRFDVRTLVQLVARNGARTFSIAAHPAVAAQLNRAQRTVAVHADFVVLARRPAAVDRNVVFLPGELEADGGARLLREHRRHEVEVVALVLVAEPAPHVLAHDPHLLRGNPQIPGEVVPAVGNALRGRIHGEVVAVPGREADAQFHLRVVDVRGRIAVLEDQIGRAETILDAAALVYVGLVLAVLRGRQIAAGVNRDRARRERRLGIQHEGQGLVFHLDEVQRFLRDMRVDCRHRGHGVADEPHGVVEQVAGIPRVAAGPGDAAVLVRDDRLHAWQRQRACRGDGRDAGVRMRTAQHPGRQHAGQTDIAGVLRCAGDALHGVDTRRGVADNLHSASPSSTCRRPAAADRAAAATTAST